MKRVLVIGSSGQAHVVIDTLEQHGEWQIVGLADSFKPSGPTALGYDILGTVEDLPALVRVHRIDAIFVGIGDNWTRGRISREVSAAIPGIEFATAVHRSAQVARKTRIGPGAIIMAGAILMPAAEVHQGAMVGTGVSLDHDSVLEEYASLAPGAVTGGNVRIGAYTAIALGARVIHGISIGSQSVIGAGSTVLADVPANSVAYGTPAKVVRQRGPSDRYL